ncbi:hypothetical protein F8D48_10230 [Adlercreutzia muris]|uniref:Uncharacterized protein n=1 Tax=Adlercreutzia muris TaxID=1796610 RepID=A0A7C8FRV2_9ACTN|nr:DUF6541 family protein [Adlercreutzia muris]KAB1640712.1 hypothetical protein F8D48_10230 [Adlercreutzia muris]
MEMLSFAIAALTALVVLYGPGCLLFRGLRFAWPLALACAPLASVSGYALVAALWGAAGVPCTATTVALPVILLYGLLLIGSKRGEQGGKPLRSSRFTWAMLALYVLAGLTVCLYVYGLSLGDPAAYYCRFDNQTHFNLARYFVDSQDWSVLHTTSGALADESQTGYYPAGWHLLVALIASLTGIELPIVMNALNGALSGVVYPLSSFALMHALFPTRRNVLLCGAFTAVGFACLPWVLLLKGQLLANLLSFSLVPAAVALTVSYVHAGARHHGKGLALCSILTIGFFGIAHPNGLFTALVFLAPFLIHTIADKLRHSRRLGPDSPWRRPLLVWFVGLAAAYALWQIMLFAPPLQQVVLYNNTGNLNLSWTEAAYAAAAFSLYPEQPPQWVLTIACIAGVIALVRQRRTWLAMPALYMLAVYAICRCVDAPYGLRTFLAGFWYSDPYRILCCAELFLVPIAALGLAAIASAVGRKLATPPPIKPIALVVGLFALVNFFPFYQEPPADRHSDVTGDHFVLTSGTAIGYMRYLIASGYDETEEQIYSAQEHAFVQRALDLIPEGALVINQPHDGSAFAYGIDGINTYFRHIDINGTTEQSRVIRDHLSEIASNPDVQQAVRDSGACYVLLLDQGVPFDEGVWLIQTGEDYQLGWQGLESLASATEGFELVLAEGDMRLYRITGIDGEENQ